MTLSDKRAAELLLTLLEAMRARGTRDGQIVVIVEGGKPTWAKIAQYGETVEIR